MRTSEELYHQVRWDPRFDPARFVLGLLQRGADPKRVPLPSFVPGGDIPWHRVLFVEADGELVWDRATGVDRIDLTGAGRVRDPRLLRAPFFTARTPYAWDPAGAGAWRPADAVPRAAGTGPATVRLLTWNTLWDRYDAPRIDTARRRPLLLAELAAADADVIALQEVEPELLRMLLAEPWVRDAYTVGTDPGGRDVAAYGLLVLSRLPVREAGLRELRAHKAVAAVTVDTAAGPLVVADTHLTSDHSQDGAARRSAELALLAEGLGGIGAEVALLGDFNDGRSGTEGPANALGFRDAWTEVHGAADDTPTFDPAANPLAAVGSLSGRAARLDRVLLESGSSRNPPARVTGAALRGDSPGPQGLFASDHFGVEASVEFDGPSDGGPAVLDGAATTRTAVAWLPPRLPSGMEELRREHDPRAERWPAHVNLLFGFVPESSFTRAAELLAEVAAGVRPFQTRLEGVHSFGHREDATLWLDPAAGGDAPWQELRRALVERFPGCRGRADGPDGYTPHLTLGRDRAPVRASAAFADRLGAGVSAWVGELAVLSRRGDGPMRVRATVELGTGRVRWAAEPPSPAAVSPPTPPTPPSPPGREAGGRDAGDRGDGDSGRDAGVEASARVVARIAGALADGVVHVAGSRRMGCALPDADLDLVAALPGEVRVADVRERISAALPDAERLREVTGARVPGLRLRVATLDVDLAVVATGALDPAAAVGRRAALGEAAAVALSAVSDAEAIRGFAGAEHAAFARLAREVKAWARARGLDSAPFGGLPGLAWTVLAARTVGEAGPRAPGVLLREFFGMWAAWDWREPVSLRAAGRAVPAQTAGTRDAAARAAHDAVGAAGPVTVLTPSEPVRSCTAQVGPGMRDLLVRELYRAWELLEGDGVSLAEVTVPPPLHRRHAAWAVVTVRAAGPREFEQSLGRTRGRLRALLRALEEAGHGDVHAWPRPFESGPGIARYAIGLGAAPPDAARLSALSASWSSGLTGVEVARVACGDVPDLR
ncbi:poly(A) polymerase [Streptomyces sp. NPDC058662]|uniref:poly(A) polymerase n=1 Tax=Streptomyces sp. NPDC058662 TaxID=3346583 RepID=UPI003657C09A